MLEESTTMTKHKPQKQVHLNLKFKCNTKLTKRKDCIKHKKILATVGSSLQLQQQVKKNITFNNIYLHN